MNLPEWTQPLREWQRNACLEWWKEKRPSELIVATPGAGKTKFSGRLAHAMLSKRLIDRLIIVVPKDHLKGQFALSMAEIGIQLDPRFSNGDPHMPTDLHGIVISYQQMAYAPHIYKAICAGRSTAVFMDEVHHVGDDARWGDALLEAFTPARFRVCLSGTPFRSDGTAIPFVEYHRGQAVALYNYDYPQALRDGVCRQVVFPLIGGTATWRRGEDGREMTASFSAKLNKQQRSERLRTALNQPQWMAAMITNAHKTLTQIRRNEGHPNAGGLIVCMNQEHAKFVARTMVKTIGVDPVVVVSADEDASEKIKRFSDSRDPWIVAVHMVSEGVDIPRLRVGGFASNVTTEMYFRQFVGRFVRASAHLRGDQKAYVYCPDDPVIRKLAADIHNEVQAYLKEKKEKLDEGIVMEREGRPESLYEGLDAQSEISGVLHGEMPSLFHAEHYGTEDDEEGDIAAGGGGVNILVPAPAKPILVADEKKRLRKQISGLVSQVARLHRVEHGKVYGTLKRRTGKDMATSTAQDLQDKVEELLRWIKSGVYDGIR